MEIEGCSQGLLSPPKLLHISLVCLYLTPPASPLPVPLFLHTSFFPGLHLSPAEQIQRGAHLAGGSGWLCGLAVGSQQTTRSFCLLQIRGVGERNWPARRDILGELAPSGNKHSLLFCSVPEIITTGNTWMSCGD